MFGEYWSLPCPLSLHWASLKDPASVPVSPIAAQHARMQVLPCRWTLRGTEALLSSALPEGRWPAGLRPKLAPLPRPQSLWGQVEIFSDPGFSSLESLEASFPLQAVCLLLQRPGGLSCCVPGITGYGPHRAASLGSHWKEERSRGCWTAQQLHETVAC